MQSEYCQQCRQPLKEWEAGLCEGCGMVTEHGLSRVEADAMARFLEAVTEIGWWKIQCDAANNKYDVENVVKAWRKIEAAAGMSGTAPEVADFYR